MLQECFSRPLTNTEKKYWISIQYFLKKVLNTQSNTFAKIVLNTFSISIPKKSIEYSKITQYFYRLHKPFFRLTEVPTPSEQYYRGKIWKFWRSSIGSILLKILIQYQYLAQNSIEYSIQYFSEKCIGIPFNTEKLYWIKYSINTHSISQRSVADY